MAGNSSAARGGRVVGDYVFGRQIGSGSFSRVWHARHRTRGTEVAVKEIVMDRLSKKLQESLLSEIAILKTIDNPHIIALHDIIKSSGKIFLVLEYCRGGDLSVYIQRHGRVPETRAKHFMKQLASGLQVLREHNVIHRDLKPQNLLLSKDDESAVLKIADFGFARSLKPMVLADTLCGSPLYMAPEIMLLQKYDAKADLWSVGVILFQLVTGRTPFTGTNQIQLISNIKASTELRFPRDSAVLSNDFIDLCKRLVHINPVERLTFEEFFEHPFLLQSNHDESTSQQPLHLYQGELPRSSSSRESHVPPLTSCLPSGSSEHIQDECIPFTLDALPSQPPARTSIPAKDPSIKSTYGFSLDTGLDKRPAGCNFSSKIDNTSRYSSKHDSERIGVIGWDKTSSALKDAKSPIGQRPTKVFSEDPIMVDSLEFIDREYVLVPGPPLEVSSSSLIASRPYNSSCESETSSIPSPKIFPSSAPMPIIGAATSKKCGIESLEMLHCSSSGNSQGSVDMGDTMEQPSSNSTTRIRSLQQCASAITELVNDKVVLGHLLEAFSVQLVILAIWKQALHICHAQAASAIEGSPSQDIRLQGSMDKKESFDSQECVSITESQQLDSSQIERAFLEEVENAEVLTSDLGPLDDGTEMPDAMEIIFQSALSFGRNGAVDELMDDTERATILYAKAVRLLCFLLVEAPSLILNPPFSLTNSDRLRLRSYIEILSSRQSQYRSQRMTLLKSDDNQQSLVDN